eukprot:c21659_g4_i4.p1 GENE.c21659_g4_i4~~c21659_g4_i4.p1  ORF type:complete len:462 (+),score=172.67 c21659_g4_i4:102-1487(+)
MSFGAYSDERQGSIIHGPLTKPGRTFSTRWVVRYYILKGENLIYYKTAWDEKPARIISLGDAKAIPFVRKDKNLFGFMLQEPDRNHTLFAKTEEEAEEWITYLKDIIKKIEERAPKKPSRIQHTRYRRASHIALGGPPNFSRSCSRAAARIEDLYELGEELGSGGFSTVYCGTSKDDSMKWALKMILNSVYQKNKERIDEEITLLAALDHPGIVRLKEVVRTSKHVVLVMELLTGGELFDRIVNRERYSENDAKTVVARMLDAVAYLHQYNICHRDLKPENLIFNSKDENAMMKLTDFGFATIVDDTKPLTATCGTPEYVAPEILDEKPYGIQSDMWSCGVIIYILLCGFPPFYGETESEMFDKICAAQYSFPSPYWDLVSDEAKSIIESLLVLDPTKRLTAATALEHPWLKHTTESLSVDLSIALNEIKRYQATRKFRKAVIAILAYNKLKQVMAKHGIA